MSEPGLKSHKMSTQFLRHEIHVSEFLLCRYVTCDASTWDARPTTDDAARHAPIRLASRTAKHAPNAPPRDAAHS